MAICHELVHLRRGDLWLGCVPALAERLFFFHPLAHVAAREDPLAREAACDAAVLRAMDATPQDYGRLLLALGVSPLARGLRGVQHIALVLEPETENRHVESHDAQRPRTVCRLAARGGRGGRDRPHAGRRPHGDTCGAGT